jgi:hypothetical protein
LRTFGGALSIDASWAEATLAVPRQKAKPSKTPKDFFTFIFMVADLCGRVGCAG